MPQIIPYITLGGWMKLQRMRAKVTQQQLAEELDYGCGQFISNWERGYSRIPEPYINKWCKLCKVNQTALVKKIMLAEKEILEFKMEGKKWKI